MKKGDVVLIKEHRQSSTNRYGKVAHVYKDGKMYYSRRQFGCYMW